MWCCSYINKYSAKGDLSLDLLLQQSIDLRKGVHGFNLCQLFNQNCKQWTCDARSNLQFVFLENLMISSANKVGI